MATETHCKIAARMYEFRDTLKRLNPDRFATDIPRWIEALKSRMARDNLDPIPAAMKMCQELSRPESRLWPIAAVVEMLEPSVA